MITLAAISYMGQTMILCNTRLITYCIVWFISAPDYIHTLCACLEGVDSFKYLGVLSTDRHILNWNTHCHSIAAKATRTLNLLKRSMSGCSQLVKVTAFQTLVCPVPTLGVLCPSMEPTYMQPRISTSGQLEDNAMHWDKSIPIWTEMAIAPSLMDISDLLLNFQSVTWCKLHWVWEVFHLQCTCMSSRIKVLWHKLPGLIPRPQRELNVIEKRRPSSQLTGSALPQLWLPL